MIIGHIDWESQLETKLLRTRRNARPITLLLTSLSRCWRCWLAAFIHSAACVSREAISLEPRVTVYRFVYHLSPLTFVNIVKLSVFESIFRFSDFQQTSMAVIFLTELEASKQHGRQCRSSCTLHSKEALDEGKQILHKNFSYTANCPDCFPPF